MKERHTRVSEHMYDGSPNGARVREFNLYKFRVFADFNLCPPLRNQCEFLWNQTWTLGAYARMSLLR